MTKKNNAVCSICGKPYYACMSCTDTIKAYPWKAFTDTANCYKVFQVVRGLSTGVYVKEEAKEKFQNVDLSDLENYREHIKKIIKDVLKEDEVAVETDEKIENTVAENVTNAKVEETETTESVVASIVSRRRNFKLNNEIDKVEE